MKDAMPLRDFLHNNGMMLSLMNNENDVTVELYTFFLFLHELPPTFLMRGLLCGWGTFFFFFLSFMSLLGPLSLCSTEVLLSSYHLTQLLCPYIKKFTGFLGGTLVEKLPLQLQPYCHSQDACWPIPQLMLHASHIMPLQYHLFNFCHSLLLHHQLNRVGHRVQELLWHIQLNQGSDSCI